MISNSGSSLKDHDDFLAKFDTTMGGELKTTAGRVLPSKLFQVIGGFVTNFFGCLGHELATLIVHRADGTPMVSPFIDIESFTLIDLRNAVKLLVQKLWGTSKIHHPCV